MQFELKITGDEKELKKICEKLNGTVSNETINMVRGCVKNTIDYDGCPEPTPNNITPTPPPPTEENNNPVPEFDVDGTPWDERIHSESKALTKSGQWRRKRNLNDEFYKQVLAELRGEVQPNAQLEVQKKEEYDTDNDINASEFNSTGQSNPQTAPPPPNGIPTPPAPEQPQYTYEDLCIECTNSSITKDSVNAVIQGSDLKIKNFDDIINHPGEETTRLYNLLFNK